MLQSLYVSVTLIMALVSSTDATQFRPSSRPEMLERKSIARRSNIISAASIVQASASFLVCKIGQETLSAVVAIGGIEGTIIECVNPVKVLPFSPPILSVIPINLASTSRSISIELSSSRTAAPVSSATISTPTSTLTSTSSSIITSIIPEASSTAGLTSEETVALNAHNVARKLHHVGPLIWDEDLAEAAARWSGGCVFAHSRGMLFPSSYTYGENIYSSTPLVGMEKVVDAFLSEESSYDYKAGKFTDKTGQFTQAVWKETEKVGCAISTCLLDGVFSPGKTQATLATCLYYPSGNWVNEYIDNVFPA